MLKRLNFKSRRLLLMITFFVLLISLSSCRSAGNPSGNLATDDTYAAVGSEKVTVGELWNELRWSSGDILTEKITEVVMKDYIHRVELIVDTNYEDLSDEDKKIFDDEFTVEKFNDLKSHYQERLQDYVIEDIYNFNFSIADSYKAIEDLEELDAKKLIVKYVDELYQNYDGTINRNEYINLCERAAENEENKVNYVTIAKKFKNIYYLSLAKELLAFENLEEDIKKAYDSRDLDNEDDLGYFSKSEYVNKFKEKFANQTELNLILIRFSTEGEFTSTLRSFGIKQYNNDWYYIPSEKGLPVYDESGNLTSGTIFSDYCDYYDDLTTTDIKNLDGDLAAQKLSKYEVALIYIQMYNYLYGGYRDLIYNTQDYVYGSVDLRSITESIRTKSSDIVSDDDVNKAISDIIHTLEEERTTDVDNFYSVDTFYTREEIDEIASNFSNYLYETLCLPTTVIENDNSKCYSTSAQAYADAYWIAYKLAENPTENSNADYEGLYNNKTVDDDLYKSIDENETLKADIETLLKDDKITSSVIDSAVSEKTKDVQVNIYDEALEINYATRNADYSKTYGKAPNENVLATLKYNNKVWNLNILEDLNDENALNSGAYNLLEQKNGFKSAIDILSRKVIKKTKEYEDANADRDEFKRQIEYALVAFSNNYYASSGYPSSIGKYNFMMLYFHTANIDEIVDNIYRVNQAGSKLLTDYNSDALLNFFHSYSDRLYENYFSISGKRLVVYQDANGDGEHDDVSKWTDLDYTYTVLEQGVSVSKTIKRGKLAEDLIHEIFKEVAASTESHDTALTNLVSEFNKTARALFEENPIAPENKWSVYRKAGLNIELEEVSATNSTTNLDFALKARLYNIFLSDDYKINDTIPTEYLEPINKDNYDILQTKDGFNLLLITSAEFQTSAEFKAEDDKLGAYEQISVYYNDKYQEIGSIYNDSEKLSKEQIRLYVLEYVTSNTSNLSPQAYSSALTNYLSPVLTRFTDEVTQSEIIAYYLETANNSPIVFVNQEDKYQQVTQIKQSTANDYIEIYKDIDITNTLNTYENWWTDLKANIGQMLVKEGGNK